MNSVKNGEPLKKIIDNVNRKVQIPLVYKKIKKKKIKICEKSRLIKNGNVTFAVTIA